MCAKQKFSIRPSKLTLLFQDALLINLSECVSEIVNLSQYFISFQNYHNVYKKWFQIIFLKYTFKDISWLIKLSQKSETERLLNKQLSFSILNLNWC